MTFHCVRVSKIYTSVDLFAFPGIDHRLKERDFFFFRGNSLQKLLFQSVFSPISHEKTFFEAYCKQSDPRALWQYLNYALNV